MELLILGTCHSDWCSSFSVGYLSSFKTTVKTILLVGFVVLALYLVFGIGPDTIWERFRDWTQTELNLVLDYKLNLVGDF